jgi:hypothetical protein
MRLRVPVGRFCLALSLIARNLNFQLTSSERAAAAEASVNLQLNIAA